MATFTTTGIADYAIESSREKVGQILQDYAALLESRTYLHLGYPYNLDYDYSALHKLVEFSINNLGDPFIESNYGVHSRSFEVAVLDWFAKLWDLEKENYWGYMTACGTEGNLHGIWMGRENVTADLSAQEVRNAGVALVASRETHYSAWKAARMYCLDAHPVDTTHNGEINYDELELLFARLKAENKRVVVVANIGTTLKGAVDDVDRILSLLYAAGFTEKEFFLHLDGALFGMMLPFVDAAEKKIETDAGRAGEETQTITFKKPGIGSISVSGHKFLGSPVPCGIVITRKQYIERLSQDISYIASRDATILGSRNGHAPVFMWYALVKKGQEGVTQDILSCVENAEYMRDKLTAQGIDKVLLNKNSCTVVFERPRSEDFVRKWQLACDNDLCHVVVMPNVSKTKIDEFIADLVTNGM